MGIVGLFKDKIKEYINIQLRLLKISIIENTSKMMSVSILILVGLFLFFCILIFAGLAIAEVLNDAGLTYSEAYLLTLGIYLFFLSLIFLFRKGLISKMSGSFISMMTEDKVEK